MTYYYILIFIKAMKKMEKYLSSCGDKNSKNYSSKIFNNSKEKNKKSKSKPKTENIIANQLFFNNNINKTKNVDSNSLFEIQDNLYIPKMMYNNNMKADKNQIHNKRVNSLGEKVNNKVTKISQDDEVNLYKEKINSRDLKIIELKEELKQLEKNYNDNNRNLINRYQNSNKINNKNVFLFYNSRKGNNIGNNKNIKKENKIVCKNNNNKATKNKSNEKKKAKSTPKIGGFMNDIKNNYFFMMSNKKCHNLNFGVKMVGMGKSLDYKKFK